MRIPKIELCCITLSVIFLFFILNTGCSKRSPGAIKFYVSTEGSDLNHGTIKKPFATIERAQSAIRELKQNSGLPEGGIEVIIRGGKYFLTKPLRFKPEDSGTKKSPIKYKAYPGEHVVISGGKRIQGWQNVKNKLWTVQLEEVRKGVWYFRQLFADNERQPRARTPNRGFYLTAGPLSKYKGLANQRAGENGWGGYEKIAQIRTAHPEALCGFQFQRGDFQQWQRSNEAEVITYHSWECSWQTIKSIDLKKNDVYFNSPCRYPIGFFSDHVRYRIENIPEALDFITEWYLDRETGELCYLAKPGYKPVDMEMIAPVLENLLLLEGDPDHKQFVEHITFLGLSFQHARYPMGIYDIYPNWSEQAIAVDPDWPQNFPPGYTDSQAAPNCGEAIKLTAASHCAFEDCEIAHIGNYAIGIGKRSHHNRVIGCHIDDVGGGGILIGFSVRNVEKQGIPREDAPSHNIIRNNLIRQGGKVHPSAVGIVIAQSHHNKIEHNEINDMGYSGISLGWTWISDWTAPDTTGRPINYCDHNIIAFNNIYNIVLDLADAGGLYSLGVLKGCVYKENYVHDIDRPEDAIGALNHGIYFDEDSKYIRVERNVVRRIGNGEAIHFNRNLKESHFWVDNDFDESDRKIRHYRVVQQAGLENQYRNKMRLKYWQRQETK